MRMWWKCNTCQERNIRAEMDRATWSNSQGARTVLTPLAMVFMRPILTGDQRHQIMDVIRPDLLATRSVNRFRIVYLAAEGRSNAQIARELRVSLHTVKRWRMRFLDFGLDGLTDAVRVGAPKRIDDQEIATFIRSYIMSSDLGSRHSIRHLAGAAGVSPTTVRKICKKNGINLADHNSRIRTATLSA